MNRDIPEGIQRYQDAPMPLSAWILAFAVVGVAGLSFYAGIERARKEGRR
jgi:hypothetical protein